MTRGSGALLLFLAASCADDSSPGASCVFNFSAMFPQNDGTWVTARGDLVLWEDNVSIIRGWLFPSDVEAVPGNESLAMPVTGQLEDDVGSMTLQLMNGLRFKGKGTLSNPLGVCSGGVAGTIAGSDLGEVSDWEMIALRPLLPAELEAYLSSDAPPPSSTSPPTITR